MTEAENTPILALRNISKRFGAVQALADVNLEIYPGEVLGLVGDNGAGKSTLVKIMAGVHQPDSGQLVFEGRAVSITNPREASTLGIETIYQDLALCDNLDVVANLYLGRETVRSLGAGFFKVVDEVSMEKAALDVIRRFHVKIPVLRTPIARLSGGQRQSVAVARAVMWNSKVVLLDEPTAALGVEQTGLVKDLIRRLREQNLGVVVISHNLADIFDVADRIIVLRLGKRVATFDTQATNPEKVVAAITGAVFGPPRDETSQTQDV